jgi:lipopolysaccharide transport system ATP-binding protein
VEKFLDTPVKRYSSGMYVRLAFAVAAHLEPEILLVDEVLAVGDMQFQKKCLGKMEDVSNKEGRTVLFVSHNMAMISSLCEKCFLLDMGQVEKEGKTSDVVMHYYTSGVQSPGQVEFPANGRPIGDEYVNLLSAEIRNEKGKITNEIDINESLNVVMKFQVKIANKFAPNVHLFTGEGLYAFDSIYPDAKVLKPGEYISTCQIPANFLNDGTYFIGLAMASVGEGIILHFFEKSALSMNVRDPIEGTPGRNGYGGPIPGVVRPLLSWRMDSAL